MLTGITANNPKAIGVKRFFILGIWKTKVLPAKTLIIINTSDTSIISKEISPRPVGPRTLEVIITVIKLISATKNLEISVNDILELKLNLSRNL